MESSHFVNNRNNMSDRLDNYRPYVLAIVRIVVAYLFFWHGLGKLMGGTALASLAGAAMVLELVGGVLLVLGLLTRLTAFILSGQMAFAYFIAHASAETWLTPMKNNGDLAVTWCFFFLLLCVTGPGAWALDNLRSGRRSRALAAGAA